MKSRSALLAQIIVVLIGTSILGLLLWEPHLEGRNAHATTYQIYFKDPFLAYVYVGSIWFFIAVYRAFKLFGEVRRKGTFSNATLDALATIKRCAMVLIGFVVGGVIIILLTGDGEDRPAGVFMGLLAACAAGLIAGSASLFARHLRSASSLVDGASSVERIKR